MFRLKCRSEHQINFSQVYTCISQCLSDVYYGQRPSLSVDAALSAIRLVAGALSVAWLDLANFDFEIALLLGHGSPQLEKGLQQYKDTASCSGKGRFRMGSSKVGCGMELLQWPLYPDLF